MISLFHVYFPKRTLLLAVSEICLIVLVFLSVSFARSATDIELWLNYEHGLLKIAVVSAALFLCMYYYDLYDSLVLGNRRETLARLFQVLGTACVVLALLYFVYPEARLGRATFLVGIGLAGLVLATSRNLFLTLNRSPRLAERVVILGDGSLAISLAREIRKRPELGLRLLGLVGPKGRETTTDRLPTLGDIEDLPALIHREAITRVIVAADDRQDPRPIARLLLLKRRGLIVLDGAAFYETVCGKVLLDETLPSRLLFSPGFQISPGLLLYKRLSSIVLAFLGLGLMAPLMAIIALAIRIESEGPILFRQRRVGKDKKLFTLYKFRSMRSEADGNGAFKPAQVNDARCTRVGRWLRRTRLDELPQLYNVLRGDMYFIGPRPFAQEEEEMLAAEIPYYALRWTIKPGASGWAQVQQGYCASVEDNTEKLAHDLFYLQNISVGLDLLILFRTTKILLWGRGAR